MKIMSPYIRKEYEKVSELQTQEHTREIILKYVVLSLFKYRGFLKLKEKGRNQTFLIRTDTV